MPGVIRVNASTRFIVEMLHFNFVLLKYL